VKRPDCATKSHRARLRSLPTLLLNKFLNEYGYDKGPVVAQAIVKNILSTIEGCYDQRVGPRQCLWMVVRVDRGKKRAIQATDLIPVRLTLITEEEIAILDDPVLGSHHQATGRCRQHRVVRMCFEAYQQGGVLTVLDLSLILGVSHWVICKDIHTHEQATGQLVPTRGTVHDIGPGVTHKAETVRRFLRGEPPDCIARSIHHSQAAVDRYLLAYQRIRLLAQRFPKDQLPTLSGVAPSVVAEYLALIQQYEPQLKLYATVTEGNQSTTTRASVTNTPRSSSAPLEAAAAGSSRSDGGGAR
jgi:hypothetical protein